MLILCRCFTLLDKSVSSHFTSECRRVFAVEGDQQFAVTDCKEGFKLRAKISN